MPLEILEKVKLDARSIDETGNVYGSLTVLSPASEFIDHAIKISYFQMLKNKM